MKFKLVETYRYWWPVTVWIPHPTEAGEVVEQTFKMQFEAISPDEATAAQTAHELLDDTSAQAAHGDIQLLKICKNWEGVVDNDDQPVPFNIETLRQAARLPWFRVGVVIAYAESLRGGQARLGN